jgi:hypothetical protein
MARAIDVKIHPEFTVDELIRYTNWPIPSPAYRENLRRALVYFQQVVPRPVLRQVDDAGPWNLNINGIKIKLVNWLQAIDFKFPVDPQRQVNKGDLLIAYKDPSIRRGTVRGNWYTFPSTHPTKVAIPSNQYRLHKFNARDNFVCMVSTASDAFVGWVTDMPPEYRHGGGHQLFVWDPERVLDPA